MSVESLEKARADKAGDARLWTPLDCLREVLRLVEAGDLKIDKIVILHREEIESGGTTGGYFMAGMTRPELIAVLAVAQANAVEDWRA